MKQKLTLFYMSDTKRINVGFQFSERHSREGREPSNNAKLFGIMGWAVGLAVDLKLLSYCLIFKIFLFSSFYHI